MNELQVFNFEEQEVRTLTVNNEPYFVGKDIAEILGYSNASKAVMNEVELLNDKRRKNLAGIKKDLIEEKGACEICGYHFKPILQIHHIEPLHVGGSDELTNLAILCPNCHKMIHALDSSYSGKFGGAEYVDDWLDINVSARRKQTYIKYALSILRKRYPESFKEVIN